MTHYTNIKMRRSEDQKDKIKKAFESKYITIRFKFSDLYGEDVFALIKSQVDRLVDAYEEKKGMKIEGGFLPALAELIAFQTGTVMPALGVGAWSGHTSTRVQQ